MPVARYNANGCTNGCANASAMQSRQVINKYELCECQNERKIKKKCQCDSMCGMSAANMQNRCLSATQNEPKGLIRAAKTCFSSKQTYAYSQRNRLATRQIVSHTFVSLSVLPLTLCVLHADWLPAPAVRLHSWCLYRRVYIDAN